MTTYIIDCESGIRALVEAPTLEEAQAEWKVVVAAGEAEPGIARIPFSGEADEIPDEHDYRWESLRARGWLR